MKAADFQNLIGTEIGVSDWMEITQDRVDAFAAATDDHQWIHVDRERAAQPVRRDHRPWLPDPVPDRRPVRPGAPRCRVSPDGHQLRAGEGPLPRPRPVGSWIRGRVGLVSVTDVEGGIQLNRQVTIEVEGTEKPAMVAETVSRLYY